MGLRPLDLAGDTWYVQAIELRERVANWLTALGDAWKKAIEPWNAMIEDSFKHQTRLLPKTDLDRLHSTFRAFRADFTNDWTDAYGALGPLTAGLKRFVAGKELPVPASRVRKLLSLLQHKLAAVLPTGVRETLPLRLIQHVEQALGMEPLVWLIPVPRQTPAPAEWSSDELACGMICVLPETSARGEVLVWIRGPYRNLGIGRDCFDGSDSPLEHVWKKLKSLAERDCLGNMSRAEDAALVVRYPNGALPSNADRLERGMWLSFFFDYGFRRQKPTLAPVDPKAEPDLILERRDHSFHSFRHAPAK
jgi:hypothetical protein